MIRRIKRIKPKKRFKPVEVTDPVKTGDEREFLFLPPLEPKKKLLLVTAGVLVVWVAFLVVLYVTTVYPMRHGKPRPKPSTEPAIPAQPLPPPTTMPSTHPARA